MAEKILDVTGVTKRFQTTVPKTVREILNLNNSKDRIGWILDNGEIKVRRLNGSILPLCSFLSSLPLFLLSPQ